MFNVNEAVEELIDDINVDYYESCYDAIYEELCNRVECGELTSEEAEMINDAAAEKYLTEGNAFNRVLNDNLAKREKIDRRIDAYSNLNSDRKSKFSDKLDDKVMDLRVKRGDYNMVGYDKSFEPEQYKKKQNYINFDHNDPYRNRDDLKSLKQDWMRAHGNKGLRPEERYKAGRYLKAQQEINSKK